MKKAKLVFAADYEVEVDDIEYESLKSQGLLVEDKSASKQSDKEKEESNDK